MNNDIVNELREINVKKKRITFGNIPDYFHMTATSLAAAEGMMKYGFDNKIDLLLDKNNWNLKRLGGTQDYIGKIECDTSPRLSVYKLFTRHGFEVHCIPWLRDVEVDVPLELNPESDFKRWDPSMKVVFQVSQLHKFISMYHQHGDEADLDLIRYAHNLTEEFVDSLSKRLNVQKVFGISVKGFFDYSEKKVKESGEVPLPVVYRVDDYGNIKSRA
jgi:hypothetical protein